MSYLVAGLVGDVGIDGLPAPAPFTYNRIEDGTLMHFVKKDELRADSERLAQIAANALTIASDGITQPATVVTLRAHPLGREPSFATRLEAEQALQIGDAFPNDASETYVGDIVVDIHLSYDFRPVNGYSIANSLNPGLVGQDQTANLILDYNGSDVRTFRASGLLQAPIEITSSQFAATSTFLFEGVRHILEGFDHVLFVLCMIIGALNLRNLLVRVTGFTIGHTITLILGFFGVAPSGAWFIPTVEFAIALSIIYAAVLALTSTGAGHRENLKSIGITSAIGLLHGFGFSFMLHQILQVDAPNVWQSLLAFNVGVEIGQVLIVLLVWPVVLFLRQMPGQTWAVSRAVVAGFSVVIATVWVVERAESLV